MVNCKTVCYMYFTTIKKTPPPPTATTLSSFPPWRPSPPIMRITWWSKRIRGRTAALCSEQALEQVTGGAPLWLNYTTASLRVQERQGSGSHLGKGDFRSPWEGGRRGFRGRREASPAIAVLTASSRPPGWGRGQRQDQTPQLQGPRPGPCTSHRRSHPGIEAAGGIFRRECCSGGHVCSPPGRWKLAYP